MTDNDERQDLVPDYTERVGGVEAQIRDLTSRLGAARDRIATLEAEAARLRASEATRFDELAILTRMIETGPVLPVDLPFDTIRSQTAHPSWAEGDRVDDTDAADRIAELDRQLVRMTKQRDALLASTSWKLTAPVRWIVTALRRRR